MILGVCTTYAAVPLWKFDVVGTIFQVQKFLAEHQSRFQDWKLPAFDDVPDWKTFVHENIQKKVHFDGMEPT